MKYKLFIIRPRMGQGGAERVTMTLLRNLNRDVFNLSLVLISMEGPYLDELPDDVRVFGLGSQSLWSAWLPLCQLLKRERPDILFSPGGTNVVAVIARTIARTKTRIVLSERNLLQHGGLTAKRRLMIASQRLTYPMADHLTAVSEGVKQDMVETLGLMPEQIQVVYNPIVDDEIQILSQEDVDHPWFSENIPIILGVGRLVPQKNFQLLFRAFANVRTNRLVRLVILGEGPLEKDLRILADELEISEDVWFGGFDKNPFKYMAKASIFVLSSLHEGLPGALIQAMACGTAVISTNCPFGPNEIITSGEDGFLVPNNDLDVLVEKIQFLLSDPFVRQEMSRKAMVTVERFRVKKVLEDYRLAIVGQ